MAFSPCFETTIFAGLKGYEMVAIVFVVFSAWCTLISAISVIFFGVSVSLIAEMYFLYITLTAVVVLAVPGAIFWLDLLQKWTQGSFAHDQERAPSSGNQIDAQATRTLYTRIH